MPQPTPDNDSQRDALELVLAAVAPRAAEAQQRLAAAEEDVRKYAELELVVQLAAMILEYPAVAAIGYTANAEGDPDQPSCELEGTVTMNPDAHEDDLAHEVDAEFELDNLLAGAGAAVAARVFEVKPGESATLHRDRLVQRAQAISTEWPDAARTA